MTVLFVRIVYLALITYQTPVHGLWAKYSSYNGLTINAKSKFPTRHRYDCALVAMETDSTVVSFNQAKMECRMPYEVPTLIDGVEGDVLYLASNSSRALFVTRNSLLYGSSSEADEDCVKLGARLMNDTEVLDLLSTTTWFRTCSCGWVLNEYQMSIDGPQCSAWPRAARHCHDAMAHSAWCLLEA